MTLPHDTSPTTGPQVAKSKTPHGSAGIIDNALSGNLQPLLEYIKNVDIVTKCPALDLTAEGWAAALNSDM